MAGFRSGWVRHWVSGPGKRSRRRETRLSDGYTLIAAKYGRPAVSSAVQEPAPEEPGNRLRHSRDCVIEASFWWNLRIMTRKPLDRTTDLWKYSSITSHGSRSCGPLRPWTEYGQKLLGTEDWHGWGRWANAAHSPGCVLAPPVALPIVGGFWRMSHARNLASHRGRLVSFETRELASIELAGRD